MINLFNRYYQSVFNNQSFPEQPYKIIEMAVGKIARKTINVIAQHIPFGRSLVTRDCDHYLDFLPSKSRSLGDLEEHLQSQVCGSINLNQKVFMHYLYPNEGCPERAGEHIAMMKKGYILSVGTERNFFNLTMCDPGRCQGIVICDVDPHVKAYNDFNVLLLRISKNFKDYQELAADFADAYHERYFEKCLAEKLSLIRSRIKTSDLPLPMALYYLQNLKEFASIYYSSIHPYVREPLSWKGFRSFDQVNYYKKPDLFTKVQAFAKNGKIVTLVQSINDLDSLRHLRIGLIDISNVDDYTYLNIRGFDQLPRIMWTSLWYYKPFKNVYIPRNRFSGEWNYFSFVPEMIPKKRRSEANKLLINFIQKMQSIIGRDYMWWWERIKIQSSDQLDARVQRNAEDILYYINLLFEPNDQIHVRTDFWPGAFFTRPNLKLMKIFIEQFSPSLKIQSVRDINNLLDKWRQFSLGKPRKKS